MPAVITSLPTIARNTKYPLDAFIFVQQGLDFAVRQIHGDIEAEVDEKSDPEVLQGRHITGAQLCHGLRRYAIHQYGLMARTVLRRWRINSCEDLGRIVFAMVDAGLMRKTDNDTLRDFHGVFDFDEAFTPQLSLSEGRE